MMVPVSVIVKVLSILLSTDFVRIIHYRSLYTQTPTQCLLEWQTFSNANTTTSKCQHLEGRYRSNTWCDDLDAKEGRNIYLLSQMIMSSSDAFLFIMILGETKCVLSSTNKSRLSWWNNKILGITPRIKMNLKV